MQALLLGPKNIHNNNDNNKNTGIEINLLVEEILEMWWYQWCFNRIHYYQQQQQSVVGVLGMMMAVVVELLLLLLPCSSNSSSSNSVQQSSGSASSCEADIANTNHITNTASNRDEQDDSWQGNHSGDRQVHGDKLMALVAVILVAMLLLLLLQCSVAANKAVVSYWPNLWSKVT